MVGGMQQGQHAAEAVSEQINPPGSGQLLDAPDGDVVVGVILQPVVGVALVGDSPVQQIHVEPGIQQPFDQAVARG